VLRVRALADGYERDSYAVVVRGNQERLAIELAPLRNALVLAGWRTLAGWSALELHTDVEPVLRMRRTREELTLVLAETALGEAARAALGGVRGALVESAEARQVGSDLVLRLALAESARTAGAPIRTFSGRDLARDRTVTLLDGSDPATEASRAADVQAAIDGLGAASAGGCALAFDAALRARLDPAELQRAFATAPPFAQAVLRAALRRLGALAPDGRLRLRDGTRLDPARPLELELALERGAQVEGALAFLRALVEALEPPEWREAALRGFAAPAADPAEFARALEDARSAETRCRSG
jgi:hypothetical protein